MYASGLIVRSNIRFFKEMYKEYYIDFLRKLDSDVKEVYEKGPITSKWYELRRFFIEPMEIYAQVSNITDNIEFAKEIGRYSAEISLTGIYRLFLLLLNRNFLIKRASLIIKKFYKGADATIYEKDKNWFKLKIVDFPEMTQMLEHCICAFIERALEISKANDVKYVIEQSITKGNKESNILFSWN